MKIFNGVFAAMVTPYGRDPSSISKERIEKLSDFLISKGVHGLFPLGTTGEGFCLSKNQRKAIAEILIKHVNKRIPVILHTGMLSTEDTIELSIHAKEIHADAIGVISPFFYHLDEEAIFDHFVSVAKEVMDLPVFVYNLPSFTNNDVSPDLLLRLAKKMDNIVGIKYSSDNVRQFREYRKRMGDDFNVFMGCDAMILTSFFEGGNGCVSGNASIYPEIISGIYNLFKAGNIKAAALQQELLDKLILVHKDCAKLSYFKSILRLRGIETGSVKRPLREASVDEENAIKQGLTKLKLI